MNASASVDPDFLGITDGMEFFWLCRDVDDHDFVISNLTSEPVLAFPELPGPNAVPVQTTGNNTEVPKLGLCRFYTLHNFRSCFRARISRHAKKSRDFEWNLQKYFLSEFVLGKVNKTL